MTITTEELHRLVDGYTDEIQYLARRVLAAEKMADAAKYVRNSYWNDIDGVIRGMYDLETTTTAYEATK